MLNNVSNCKLENDFCKKHWSENKCTVKYFFLNKKEMHVIHLLIIELDIVIFKNFRKQILASFFSYRTSKVSNKVLCLTPRTLSCLIYNICDITNSLEFSKIKRFFSFNSKILLLAVNSSFNIVCIFIVR